VDSARADQLAWDYCAELIAAGQLENSAFVALHLSRAIDRERLIKEILASFTSKLHSRLNTNGDTNAVWFCLTSYQSLFASPLLAIPWPVICPARLNCGFLPQKKPSDIEF